MNRVTKAACLMLCIAAPLGAAAGQSSPDKQPSTNQQSTPTAEQTSLIEPSLQKILSVLDQLMDAQKSFSDNDLRIAIRAQVADMLWRYDEPRARMLFEDAFRAMAITTVRERSIWVAPVGPDASNPVRNVVIPAIVRRDPSLAASLAENITDLPPTAYPKVRPGGHDEYAERSLMRSQVASLLSYKDPRLSAQVGKVFAERGDIMRLDPLLEQIRMRDPKAADELFILALERAKLGKPSVDDIRWFGSYLFPHFGEGVIMLSSGGAKRDPLRPATRNPQAIPPFLDLAYEVVNQLVASISTSNGAAHSNTQYSVLKLLMPYFDRFMPDKAVSFRALVDEVLSRAPEEERSFVALSDPGTVEELLARADTLAESRQKDALYSRASAQAMMSRNLDQAAAIIARISDERVRANETSNLRIRMYQYSSEETGQALERNDFEKAEALIAGTSDSHLRLQLLGSLIERLVQKEKLRALQMLDEAERLALSIENRVQRARQLMVLAGIAARIDVDRGFDKMKLAVTEFNRAGVAPEWEKYRVAQSNSEAEKEPMFTNIGVSSLLNDKDFQSLGSKDLNRALAVAQEIQMKEASALAQLAVCRGALRTLQAPTPPKPISPAKQP